MKKVILIAYYYFKKENIASNRTTAIHKYLPEFGWDVTLITPPPLNNHVTIPKNIIAIPNYNPLPLIAGYLLNKTKLWSSPISMHVGKNSVINETSTSQYFNRVFNTLVSSLQAYPISDKVRQKIMLFLQSLLYSKIYTCGWHSKPINTAINLINNGGYDAIISTYGPATTHEVASLVQKKTGIPWIADYRDLWSENHEIKLSKKNQNKLLKYEANVVSRASYITTVSHILANKLETMHNKKTAFILNGFDPIDINSGIKLRPKFTITYTGTLYSFHQSTMLFAALRELLDLGKIVEEDVDVRYYGPIVNWLNADILHYNLENIVKQCGVIPKEDAKMMQKTSQLLLLLGPQTELEDGCYTGKIYEYFAAKRPIIALGRDSNNVIRNIINETSSGVYFTETESLINQLEIWYQTYKKEDYISYGGNMNEIEKYSYRAMAQKFAFILDDLTHPDGPA